MLATHMYIELRFLQDCAEFFQIQSQYLCTLISIYQICRSRDPGNVIKWLLILYRAMLI